MDRVIADNYYIKETKVNGVPGYMSYQCFGKEEYGQFIPKESFPDFCKEAGIDKNKIQKRK